MVGFNSYCKMLATVIWLRWVSGFVLLFAGLLGAQLMRSDLVVVDPVVSADAPRGIRNKNPGNIEHNPGNDWRGQVGSDGRYAVFDNPVNGIRALARLLVNYGRFYGLVSVGGIISRWAPDSENDTASYVRAVSDRLGVQPFDVLEDGQLPDLVKAIIHHENGVQPYSDSLINAGVRAAR